MNNNSFHLVFKEALKKDELQNYFNRLQNGDMEARNILIEHNLRLVSMVIIKNFPFNDNIEDLTSIGTIGLIKAVDTYNYQKGFQFSSYATKCIKNEILLSLRKNHIEESLDQIQGNNENFTLKDCIPDKYDFVEDILNHQIYLDVLNYIDNLPKFEKILITLYFGIGNEQPLNFKEIGQKMNTNQSNVSKIIKKNLLNLKTLLTTSSYDNKTLSKKK